MYLRHDRPWMNGTRNGPEVSYSPSAAPFGSFAMAFDPTADARPPLLSALGTAFSDVASLFVAEGETLGVVPSDEDDVSAPTVLANLYLPPVQLLLIVRWVRAPVFLCSAFILLFIPIVVCCHHPSCP